MKTSLTKIVQPSEIDTLSSPFYKWGKRRLRVNLSNLQLVVEKGKFIPGSDFKAMFLWLCHNWHHGKEKRLQKGKEIGICGMEQERKASLSQTHTTKKVLISLFTLDHPSTYQSISFYCSFRCYVRVHVPFHSSVLQSLV